MEQNTLHPEDVAIFKHLRTGPDVFVQAMFGLKPQPVKQEYREQFNNILLLTWEAWESGKKLIKPEWFEEFKKGEHVTWQQYLILVSVRKGIAKEASPKISIVSGHGIGKSSCISWIILWFLFCHYNSQVPCTAPTADQMYDVLWKELNLWIARMPDKVRFQYIWARDHIRMAESPETWFARAKTSSKENSEALAGVHADWVLTVADEASGVEEAIFNTAEGAWTSGNIIVILISNGTRSEGYFFDTHHKLRANWQCLAFDSTESPIVDDDYEAQIAERHGRDSDEYKIRVKGGFPSEGVMDDSGYIALFPDKIIHTRPDMGVSDTFKSTAILGIDPSGEGDDKTSFVLRDNFKAKKIHEEQISNSKGIAEKAITFITDYGLNPRNVVIDALGVGMDVAKEIALATKGEMRVTTVNLGDLPEMEEDQELYMNKRAEAFWKARTWCMQGGEFIDNKNMEEEMGTIKYKRNMRNKIQIMPKVDMKKRYGNKSPNDADAFALTFLRDIPKINAETLAKRQRILDELDFDPYAVGSQ